MAQVESEIKESSTNESEALIATLPTREGWSTPLTLYNNCWLRSHMLRRFMLVRDNFKPRRDDIILATHPKSGTTWLKALAFTISTRSRCDLTDSPLLTTNPQRVVPFIGAVGGDLDFLETLPSPRLLATHLPLSLLPPAPKDAFVSRWHFDNKMGKGAPIALDVAFSMFCQGFSPFGPFWDHYLQYWKESLARPQEVMFLKYEEIVSDPLTVVRKLASFLDVPFTEEEEKSGVVDQVVSFCSFESLRKLDVNKTGGAERAGGKIFIQHSSLFRKGKVGDWVNHMSEEMGEKMDRLVEEKFKGSGLEL
ncbi:Sulfotransferase 17 [Triticum urartu]|uniref:Sulfotransferase n=1 Tax=Triticum urartu TaxID=4572 RepID=M7YZC9_TRIUA|nr:Sulfotransferase 17 [Triticum urartu]